MAEAHQAVAFQFAVTEEGISVHFDREAVKVALKVLLSWYRRTYFKTRNAILRGVFPATPLSLLVILVLISGLFLYGIDPTYGGLDWLRTSRLVE